MDLTQEQINIVTSNEHLLLVQAFSGTGKTHTLRELCRLNKDSNILYLCFNKHTSEEAKGSFPKNVRVMTFHAYAYSAIGADYKNKIVGKLPLQDSMKLLALDGGSKNRIIVGRLLNYINEYSHSPFESFNLFLLNTLKNKKNINLLTVLGENILSHALDPKSKYPITFDLLLKKFSATANFQGYQYVVIDECQDMNGVTAEIVKRNRLSGSKIIMVGDFFQSIYSFRGATAVMNGGIVPSKTMYLTKTFRFGKNIAKEANKILSLRGSLRGIVGNSDINDVVTEGLGFGAIDRTKGYTVISRTNAGVIASFIDHTKDNNLPIVFVGGSDGYGINMALSVFNLYKGIRVSEPVLSKYLDFGDLLSNANEFGDEELFRYALLVLKYKDEFPKIVADIKLRETNNEDGAIVFSTAHKSKGMEYSQVILNDDFREDSEEELNIKYVAITRAKESLHIRGKNNE